MDDGTVFRSMREFWLWVIVVTLLIFVCFLLFLGILHVETRLNKADRLIKEAQKLTETKEK
jgi:hypothetical protein